MDANIGDAVYFGRANFLPGQYGSEADCDDSDATFIIYYLSSVYFGGECGDGGINDIANTWRNYDGRWSDL